MQDPALRRGRVQELVRIYDRVLDVQQTTPNKAKSIALLPMAHAVSEFRSQARIEVLNPCRGSQLAQGDVPLLRGMRGTVVFVDDVGDAKVRFDDYNGFVWIQQTELKKLRLTTVKLGVVEVMEAFSAMNESLVEVELRPRLRGHLLRVDADGDAFARFEGVEGIQLIEGQEFRHLLFIE